MKRRENGVIGEFYSKDAHNLRWIFQLVKKDDKYVIKRGSSTLFMFNEEDKARKGFQALRARWSV